MPKEPSQKRIYNSTFKGVQAYSHFNACVGNNGRPDLPEYASGFMDAALRLSELVIRDPRNNLVDYFIYPISFNMRHGIEIWLKYFLTETKHIRDNKILDPESDNNQNKIISEKDLTKTHDINTFWHWFRFNSERKDDRFLVINDRLNEIVSDIGEIDPTGQTFRYPYDTESQKHLVETPIINLINLKEKIHCLGDLVKELRDLIHDLKEEYNTQTYTANLSRIDIEHISKILPHRINWSQPEFANAKKQIKDSFSLSNNEFSKAINIIKSHYEFSRNVGITPKLKSATIEDLKLFINTWIVFNPERPKGADDGFIKGALMEIFSNSKKLDEEHEALCIAAKNISIESQADIGTLYYLAQHSKYSESYEELYSQELLDIGIKQGDRNCKEDPTYLYHILNKANFIRYMVRSLRLLGQDKFLTDLKKDFEIVDTEIERTIK